jgi:hypothetical protein
MRSIMRAAESAKVLLGIDDALDATRSVVTLKLTSRPKRRRVAVKFVEPVLGSTPHFAWRPPRLGGSVSPIVFWGRRYGSDSQRSDSPSSLEIRRVRDTPARGTT